MSQDPKLSRGPDYYAARAVEERRHAMAAADLEIRAIHLDLAKRYAKLAETGGSEPQEVIGTRRREA